MYLLTRFPDGTTVHAVPLPGASAVEELHDIIHLLLAEAMKLEHSPSLWNVTHRGTAPKTLLAFEEAAVLAIQRFAQALAEVE